MKSITINGLSLNSWKSATKTMLQPTGVFTLSRTRTETGTEAGTRTMRDNSTGQIQFKVLTTLPLQFKGF